ncbi:MAG: hypothetical protein J0M29_21640 [Chitinophagales bacterium]|nr:hypothetical protein [Chitinophagales bacterium]
MPPSSFFQKLLLISALTGLVLAGLHFLVAPAQEHAVFSVVSTVLFMLICLGLYYAGKSTAGSKNRNAFTNLVSVSVFGKMVVALAVLFIYQQTAQPTNQWFVGIFLWCYVVFTAFEVWFMTKLARS